MSVGANSYALGVVVAVPGKDQYCLGCSNFYRVVQVTSGSSWSAVHSALAEIQQVQENQRRASERQQEETGFPIEGRPQ